MIAVAAPAVWQVFDVAPVVVFVEGLHFHIEAAILGVEAAGVFCGIGEIDGMPGK